MFPREKGSTVGSIFYQSICCTSRRSYMPFIVDPIVGTWGPTPNLEVLLLHIVWLSSQSISPPDLGPTTLFSLFFKNWRSTGKKQIDGGGALADSELPNIIRKCHTLPLMQFEYSLQNTCSMLSEVLSQWSDQFDRGLLPFLRFLF